MKKIIRTPQSSKKNLTFDYGPMGNRIAKHVYNNQTGMLESSTYYLLDAQGNQLSMYKHVVDTATATASYYLTERNIYGSSRLGMVKDTVNMQKPSILPSYGVLGNRKYALTNHLNNVLTVISDVVYPLSKDNTTIDGYEVGISSVTDYSPFGVELDGRSFSNSKFRYSFQNQEVDKETGLVNYKYRMHNPLLGRFLSIDPLSRKYPWNSSYAFSENRVIDGVELEGKEYVISVITFPNEKPYLKVKRDDNIKLGYYRLVYVRKGATAVGIDETGGGSDIRSRLLKFNKGKVTYGLVGFNNYIKTLSSQKKFSTTENLSKFIKQEIRNSEKVMDKLQTKPEVITGEKESKQTIGGNVVSNPKTFDITTSGTAKALYENFKVDPKATILTIAGANTGSKFIQEIKSQFEQQGYTVDLVNTSKSFEGDIKVEDSDNSNGISIRLNIGYTSTLKVFDRKDEIKKVKVEKQ